MRGREGERDRDGEGGRERERERERKNVVPAAAAVLAAAATAAAAAVSRLPSSRVALALAVEGSSVPILAITAAADFHRGLATLASSRRSR